MVLTFTLEPVAMSHVQRHENDVSPGHGGVAADTGMEMSMIRCPGDESVIYFFAPFAPTMSCTVFTTRSGVRWNSWKSCGAGADAPK